MKKVLSTAIIAAMLLSITAIGYAQGKPIDKEKNEKAVKVETQVEEVGDLEEAEVEEETENEEEKAKAEKDKLKEEAKQTKEEYKQKEKALKDQFKEAKTKEERKAILAEIAKVKREAKESRIGVFVKGKDVEFDVPPVIKGGRTLIPVRAVVNALGAKVDWDAENRIVTITKTVEQTTADSVYEGVYTTKEVVIKLQIDSNVAIVDGKEVQLDESAQINTNRTIVPLRFISETFGMNVDWDGDSGTVIIEDKEEEVTEEQAETVEPVEQEDSADADKAATQEEATDDTPVDSDAVEESTETVE